jgi:hypothetical protein
VDDILVAYAPKHQNQMDAFEAKLLDKYEIRNLGEAEHFLGIQIV